MFSFLRLCVQELSPPGRCCMLHNVEQQAWLPSTPAAHFPPGQRYIRKTALEKTFKDVLSHTQSLGDDSSEVGQGGGAWAGVLGAQVLTRLRHRNAPLPTPTP